MALPVDSPVPIELHLPDGGHVIVTFAEASLRSDAATVVVDTLVTADGTEAEIGRAISELAEDLGLSATESPDRHPTVIVVR
jgi:hypothetical protein